MPSTETVLDHHLTAFDDGDLSALMDDYSDASVVITPDGLFRGRDDIETMFEGMLAEFDQPGVSFELDERVVTGETAFIVWHAETPDAVYEYATDTFVVRDGVIETQTFAAKTSPTD